MKKLNDYLDKIFENRGFYIRYLLVVLVCSLIRYALGVLLNIVGFSDGDDSFVAWCLWAVILYPLLKYIVFKYRAPHIFALLTQMMLYVFCIAALWVIRSVIIGLLFVLTSSAGVAMGIGGAICELLCLGLMINVVFRNVKS